MVLLTGDWILEEGNTKFKALGAINVDVSMKNINSRKIISVKEDMLKEGLILFLVLIPMIWFYAGS